MPRDPTRASEQGTAITAEAVPLLGPDAEPPAACGADAASGGAPEMPRKMSRRARIAIPDPSPDDAAAAPAPVAPGAGTESYHDSLGRRYGRLARSEEIGFDSDEECGGNGMRMNLPPEARQRAPRPRPGSVRVVDPPETQPYQYPGGGTLEDERLPGNRRKQGTWLTTWLHFLRHYFLFLHLGYMLIFVAFSGLAIYLSELNNTGITYWDSYFIAVSAIANTGLATCDVTLLNGFSTFMRHLTMVAGGAVVTSTVTPLLRLYTLRKLKEETRVDDGDRRSLIRWKLRKRAFVERLETTAAICAVVPLVYWALWQFFGFLIVYSTGLVTAAGALGYTVATFQNSMFEAVPQFSTSATIVITFSTLTAAGGTLFAVFLRLSLQLARLAFKLHRRWRCCSLIPNRSSMETDALEDSYEDGGGRPQSIGGSSRMSRLARSMVGQLPRLLEYDATWDTEAPGMTRWERGLTQMLQSRDPSIYHAFLFTPSDTLYLVIAFLLITIAQCIPLLTKQWDGILAHIPPFQKIIVAIGQAVSVRFCGTTFIDVNNTSQVHIMWLLFAMYIPLLPIPTDRGRRKWKQMITGGAMRLLSSRIFLLFMSVTIVIWVEESRLAHDALRTNFDIFTYAIFEVFSGYSTSGIAITLPGSPGSFASSCTFISQVVFAVDMLCGRHRWMDVGIDIGLDELDKAETAVEALLEATSVPAADLAPPLTESNDTDTTKNPKRLALY